MLASKYVRGGNRRPERISRTDRVAGGGIRVIPMRATPMRATPPAMSCDYPTKGTPQGGILLPQQKLHPAQQGAGGQFCGRDGKVDRLMLDFFLHRYHLLCRKSS